MLLQDLIRDLKSELSGDLEELILGLFMPTSYYDAWTLKKAMEVRTAMNAIITIELSSICDGCTYVVQYASRP